MWAGEQTKEKSQNGCHFRCIRQNDFKSNQHIAEAYVHIHTKYEVYMTICMDKIANQNKKCYLKYLCQNDLKSNQH